ncbi:hypothetical protein DFH06DRAFT_1166985, partial [Mycena polygramma]
MAWISSILPLPLSRGISRAFELDGINPPEDEGGNFPPFERSLDNLLATRNILLQFFPPELVYIILDLAEYWVHTELWENEGENPVYSTGLQSQYLYCTRTMD